MACGEDDGLLGDNQKFSDFLTKEGIPYTLEIGPGAHEWDFCDRYIKKTVQEWLPLDKGTKGINSGNVKVTEEK